MPAVERINAAGATFPAPLYQRWFGEYQRRHPQVQINYQAIGSGGGIRQLEDETVDFGASDMPMTDAQLARVKTKPLHLPTVLGAVVPIYNLPGVTEQLRFTPETLSGIFLGTIRNWKDARLKPDNPAVKLPDKDIVVVHRSDGSGTSFVWTDYLSKVSPEWKRRVGAGTSVRWPVGLGSKGNEGVAGLVKQMPYAIGYVELIYAARNGIGHGLVRNAAGQFVKADLASLTEAAASAAGSMPPDFRVSITDAPGREAYPISTFTWLLVPSRIPDAGKARAIKGFLRWMLASGEHDAVSLAYAPLPRSLVAKEEQQIARIQ